MTAILLGEAIKIKRAALLSVARFVVIIGNFNTIELSNLYLLDFY